MGRGTGRKEVEGISRGHASFQSQAGDSVPSWELPTDAPSDFLLPLSSGETAGPFVLSASRAKCSLTVSPVLPGKEAKDRHREGRGGWAKWHSRPFHPGL